jgi:hypothetical protein
MHGHQLAMYYVTAALHWPSDAIFVDGEIFMSPQNSAMAR